jgi:mannosylglycoprotein endo-beta-mannosidase
MRIKFCVALAFLILSNNVFSQHQTIKLNNGWKAKKASELVVDGTIISSKDFKLYDWMDAVVPGTVLTTLLHNGKVLDPFFGMNNEQIPDIYEVGASHYTYWFFNEFKTPKVTDGEQVWLKFRGINYSAELFVNGQKINPDNHQGMYLREKYLITPYLTNGSNRLAVLVHPPDPVGAPNGQGGDGTIARSVTMQFTAGWDWICPIKDRNTGIWDEVSIETTGSVDLLDPFVQTLVPGKRIPEGKQEPATILTSADLLNSSLTIQTGILVARCGAQEVSKKISIPAGQKISVSLPEFKIQNPQLWWPNGTGDHPLYQMEFSFKKEDGSLSDQEKVSFGIRQTSTHFDIKLNARVFSINGQDIFIKGGNWIASDALLRLSPERYDADVRMHAQMNMNMIRVWGGSMTERPDFYDACDKYGLLVWQDLFISGDCNGRWFDPMKKESQDRRRAYPDNHSLFISTVVDQTKMLRNHPSLYLWCGGNEYPPPADIDAKLKNDIFPKFDPTRFYLDQSTSTDLSKNEAGVNGDGPYTIQNPLSFFTVKSFAFNPELGSVGVPNVETIRKIMEEKDLVVPSNELINPVWVYHKYIKYQDYIDNYGKANEIVDFCKKAQIVNYEQYRALQEGFNAGMWKSYTGMLVWKNQNPWTALRGQFYDVFLEQNGGFYGYQHGAKPIHAQLNLNDSSVCLVNQTVKELRDLTVVVEQMDIHGRVLTSEKIKTTVAANVISNIGKVSQPKTDDEVYFLRLQVLDQAKTVQDENIYWLSKPGKSYTQLNNLKTTAINAQVKSVEKGKKIVHVVNSGTETAFFIRLKVLQGDRGELALPVFFSDNYITLFPRESKDIEVDYSQVMNSSKSLSFAAEGWNVKNTVFKFE